jgi:twitching motility protein PilT
VSSQLQQILGYLDQENVSEVVLAVGRKISIRQDNAYASLTAKPLTRDQLMTLVRGTRITALVPDGDTTESAELELFGRRLRVQVGRRGDEIVVRIDRAKKSPVVSLALDEPLLELAPEEEATRARSGRATSSPRAKAGTAAPRVKGATSAPRSKGATNVPRAKPPTHVPRVKATTSAPRSMKPSSPPRPKEPTKAGKLATDGAFESLVRTARERGASDLHIATGRPVSIRTVGELVPLDSAPLSVTAAEALLLGLLEPVHHAQLARSGYVDLAVDAPGGGRLRANISRQQAGLKGTFRLAIEQPATLDQLGLPKELAKIVGHHQGLVVIAGPSGHGKTTTLAALVDLVNSTKPYHILTIEDPIEIVHPRKLAVVSQREAGRHTKSFATALKASLREDPDVIVIGELRDRESVEIALTAAETGHLVLSTMSTPNAAKTIDRLIDMFPPDEHTQVRASIAGALRAILAQRLLPSAKGSGVVAAVEMVTGVLPLANLIRDDKLYQLPNLMQRGRAFGMIRFDDSLIELLRAGKITEDAAIAASENKKELTAMLRPVVPPVATPKLGRALFGKRDE